MMLTVELKGVDEVEIHCDRDGLVELIERLNLLLQRTDHIHLMTKSWGLGDLSEQLQGTGTTVVHHLKVYRHERFVSNTASPVKSS
jgi:hypothetical protein